MNVTVFIINAVIGAFVNVLIHAKSWRDITKFSAVKSLVTGGIAGYVYYYLVTEHGFPDGLMAFVVGYTAHDFFDWLVRTFSYRRGKTYKPRGR